MTRAVLLLAAGLMSVAFVSEAWSTPTTIMDRICFRDTHIMYDPLSPPDTLDDWDGNSVRWLEFGGDFVVWTHNFTLDPGAEGALRGRLRLFIKDDEDDQEATEWALIAGEDWSEPGGVKYSGEVNTGEYSFGVTGSYLEDGSYQVGVQSLQGDFILDQSVLEITYEPIPEASTLMMLGSGLPGLALWARSRRRRTRE